MSRLVRVCAESDLPVEGQVRECVTGDGTFCVARVQGQVAVLDNTCPHEGGPLGEGMIQGGRVVCPWHGWSFDVKTGAELYTPSEKAKVYESRIESGELRVVLE